MFPLPAGGHGVLRHRAVCAGGSLRCHRQNLSVMRLGISGLLFAAVLATMAGSAAAGTAPAVDGAVIPAMAPANAQAPNLRTHWTQRAPVVMAKMPASEDTPAQGHVRSHVQVSMFSWRELLFYAMGAVIVVAGLLAFTANGSGHRSRHS